MSSLANSLVAVLGLAIALIATSGPAAYFDYPRAGRGLEAAGLAVVAGALAIAIGWLVWKWAALGMTGALAGD